MKRAHAMVAVGIEGDELKIKSIVVYGSRVAATDLSELFFEWFSVTGFNYPKAMKTLSRGSPSMRSVDPTRKMRS